VKTRTDTLRCWYSMYFFSWNIWNSISKKTWTENKY